MEPFEILMQLAARQELLFATWQAVVLGIDADLLIARITTEGWQRWLTGVIGLPAPKTARRRVMAALLAYSKPRTAHQHVRTDAGVSVLIDTLASAALAGGQLLWGPSALWAYGLADLPAEIWIRLANRTGHVARDGVRLRFGALAPGIHMFARGFPVPVIEQAFLEYAAWCGSDVGRFSTLLELIAAADAKRLTTLDKLEEYLMTLGPVSGKRTLVRAVASLRGTLSHSRTEAGGRRIVTTVAKTYGLTVGQRPMPIYDNGVLVAEADVPVLEIRLDLEIDGPHHDMPAQHAKDIKRDRKVRSAEWEVERFPTKLVQHSPDQFRAQVDRAIRDRLRALKLEQVQRILK